MEIKFTEVSLNHSMKKQKVGVSDGSRDEEKKSISLVEAFCLYAENHVEQGNFRMPRSKRPPDDLKAKLVADLRVCMEAGLSNEHRLRNSAGIIDVSFVENFNLVILARFHPKRGIVRRGWLVLFPDHLDKYDWAYLKSWFKDTVEYGPIWNNEESANE